MGSSALKPLLALVTAACAVLVALLGPQDAYESVKTTLAMANLKLMQKSPDRALLWSVRHNVTGAVEHYLSLGANASYRSHDYSGDALIHMASDLGNAKVVGMLVEHGAPVDQRDTMYHNVGKTPLMKAAAKGHTHVVKYLIKAGANVSLPEFLPPAAEAADTPLHVASKNGHKGVVRALLDADCVVDYPGAGGWSALTFAAERQHPFIARSLVVAGADVNWRGWDKNTPLHWAAKRGDFEIVELLLSKGAKASFHNKDGATPADVVKEQLREASKLGLEPETLKMYTESFRALEERLRGQEKDELATAKAEAKAKKAAKKAKAEASASTA